MHQVTEFPIADSDRLGSVSAGRWPRASSSGATGLPRHRPPLAMATDLAARRGRTGAPGTWWARFAPEASSWSAVRAARRARPVRRHLAGNWRRWPRRVP